MDISFSTVRAACSAMLSKIKNLVADHIEESDLDIMFKDMTKTQTDQMLAAMYENGMDVHMLSELKKNGQIVNFIPNEMLLSIATS